MIADAVLGDVREVGMARTEAVLDGAVVLGALVLVADQQRDRRTGGDLPPARVGEHAREDFYGIGLLTLCDEARAAGLPAVEIALDVGRVERDAGRAAVDDTA